MVRVNFLPADYQYRTDRNMQSLLTLIVFFFTMVLVGSIVYVHSWELRSYESQLETVQEQIRLLAPYVSRLDQLQKSTKDLNRKLTDSTFSLKALAYPEKLMREISEMVPDTVWFGQLQMSGDGKIAIYGQSSTYDGVVEFEKRLAASQRFVDPVIAGLTSTITEGGTPTVSFKLEATLRR